jgi:RHS repeat-associated protein
MSMTVRAAAIAASALFTMVSVPVRAADPHAIGEQDAFHGAFQTAVPIEVPPFQGVEPQLVLAYGSQNANGVAGVGWALHGFSTIERVRPGRGTPSYGPIDRFLLDGEELVPCSVAAASPGCAAGGTHATRIESYTRIKFDAAANTWTVWQKDGRRTELAPVYVVAAGTFRWGQVRAVDARGNAATYGWWCDPSADCYPSSVAYGTAGELRVALSWELRPDEASFANGEYIGRTRYRLRSAVVTVGSAPVRGYALTYATSASSGRSLLTSVRQYGRDLTVDATGRIVGGTALPPQTFAYQVDPGGTLTLSSMVDPSTGTEAVRWAKQICAVANGNAVTKQEDYACLGTDWDSGASSTRAIVSGDGWVEFGFYQWQGATVAGLGIDDTATTIADVEWGIYRDADGACWVVESGFTMASLPCGAVYRVAVEGGHVKYYRDGGLYYTSARLPSYPLRFDVAMTLAGWSGVAGARISGSLADIALWCENGRRSTGDFNGDGKTDLLCDTSPSTNGTSFAVRLGTGTGFGPPTTWLSAGGAHRGTGDFDGDGKTDVWLFDLFTGTFSVALSTGTAFTAPVAWGSNGVCRIDDWSFTLSTGDFDGDGRTDVACQRGAGDTYDGVWIGLSTGSSFVHGRWSTGCSRLDNVGAVDFNGDGKSDWLCIAENGGLSVQISNGAAFDDAALVGSYIGAGICGADRWLIGDYNGDGNTDAACKDTGQVFLSTGRRFLAQPATGGFCTGAGDQLIDADLNGDGMADWVCNHAGVPASDIEVRAGVAGGVSPTPVTWRAGWCVGKLVALDFNGDRKHDLLCDEALAPIGLAGTPGAIADVMTSLGNGLGATTTISYRPSTDYANTNNPPVVYVITQIMTDDGRDGRSTSSFAYQGGLEDRRERRFLGFRYAIGHLPCADATCPYDETWFRQDTGSVSKPERIDRRDAAGRLLASTIHEFTTNGATIPYTSLLTGTWRHDYDGTGAACPAWPCAHGKRSYVSYGYDGYANQTQVTELGDADASGDERVTVFSYAPAVAPYLVGLISSRSRFEGVNGPLVEQRLWLYDDRPWNTPPVRGLVTAQHDWHDRTNTFVARQFAYDAVGNVITAVDRTGATTHTSFDASARFPTSVSNPLGQVTTTAWDPVCGEAIGAVDPNGSDWHYQYDALCRLVQTTMPLGGYELRSFIGSGNPAAQYVEVQTPSADGAGNQWARSYYDGLGRIYQTRAKGPGSDIVSEQSFDPRGLVATRVATRYAGEPAQTTRYSYDALERLTALTLPDQASRTTSYGAWTRSDRDPMSHEVSRRFDAYGRVIEEHDGDAMTALAYNARDQLTSVTDSVGNRWTWSFDSLGRADSTRDPDSGARSFGFDAEGRVLAMVDAKQQRTELSWDALGRARSQTSLAGTSNAATVSWIYDEVRAGFANIGRQTTLVDAFGTSHTDFDGAGRPAVQVRTIDGAAYPFAYSYDTGNRLRTVSYPDGDMLGTKDAPLGYDAAGRLSRIPGVVDSATYDAAGRVTVQSNANATNTTYSYNPQRRWIDRIRTVAVVTGIKQQPPAIQNLSYARDADGNVTRVTSPLPHESWSYTYDRRHQLLASASQSDPADNQTFSYDLLGRMTYNSRIGNYAYGDQYAPPHAVVQAGDRHYSYDAAGNMTSSNGLAIAYDGRNRPTALDGASYHATYGYDGNGERITQTHGGTTTHYIGDTEITDGVATKYIRLGGHSVAKRIGTATYWLHTDQLGSIQSITDASGSEVQHQSYRAYGERLATATGHPESHGWIDEHQDDSGLIYLHARYYDPALGRFLSPDPSHPLRPGVGLDRYGYSGGDPINAFDRSGLDRAVPRFPGGVSCPGSGPSADPACPNYSRDYDEWLQKHQHPPDGAPGMPRPGGPGGPHGPGGPGRHPRPTPTPTPTPQPQPAPPPTTPTPTDPDEGDPPPRHDDAQQVAQLQELANNGTIMKALNSTDPSGAVLNLTSMQWRTQATPSNLPTGNVYLESHGPIDVANYTSEVLSDMANVMDPSGREPIVLISCNGAVIGQDLADTSGRNVLAYHGDVSVTNIVSPASPTTYGEVFRPRRGRR